MTERTPRSASNGATPPRVSIGTVRTEDLERVLQLNEHFRDAGIMSAAQFERRLTGSPAGHAIVPVLRDDMGQVVGHIWVVPQRALVRGETLRVAQSMDLIIDPRFRGTMAYPRLMRRQSQVYVDERIPVHVACVSNHRYQQVRENPPEGWSVERHPLLVRPLNLWGAVRRLRAPAWKKALGYALAPLLAPLWFKRRVRRALESVTVSSVDRFDGHFDEFWKRVAGRLESAIVRDSAYLTWRFPVGDYHTLVARDGAGRLIGYAVLLTSTLSGMPAGKIMDLLVSDVQVGHRLVLAAERWFGDREVAVGVAVAAPGTVERQVFDDMGYRALPDLIQKRALRLMCVPHPEVDHEARNNHAKDWFVSLADRERD